MAQTITKTTAAAPMPVAAQSGLSHVDWPAIIAGAVLAAAIAFVLGSFGAAVGLSLVSPYAGEGVAPTVALIAVGLWLIWVSASSFMCGAYLTGRLRRRVPDATEHEVDVRDGAHGLVVWALGAILGAALLGSGAATTAKLGASGVGAAAGAATAAGGAVAAGDDGSRYLIDRLFRVPPGATGQATTADEDGSIAEAARILTADLDQEALPADDREYLAAMVAQRTGLGQDEALARVDQAHAQLHQAAAEARAAAEAARKYAVVAAFVLAASLLIGAAGAYWAAGVGGRHRDRQTVFAWFTIR